MKLLRDKNFCFASLQREITRREFAYYDSMRGDTNFSYVSGSQHQPALQGMISDLSPEDVILLGSTLGLSHACLKKYGDYVIHGEMVHMWLLGADNTRMTDPVPTWRSFARGLLDIGLVGIVVRIMTGKLQRYLYLYVQ